MAKEANNNYSICRPLPKMVAASDFVTRHTSSREGRNSRSNLLYCNNWKQEKECLYVFIFKKEASWESLTDDCSLISARISFFYIFLWKWFANASLYFYFVWSSCPWDNTGTDFPVKDHGLKSIGFQNLWNLQNTTQFLGQLQWSLHRSFKVEFLLSHLRSLNNKKPFLPR